MFGLWEILPLVKLHILLYASHLKKIERIRPLKALLERHKIQVLTHSF